MTTESQYTRIADLRSAAQKGFQDMSWPNTSEEEWRRTDLSVFDLDELGDAEAEVVENTRAERKSGSFHTLAELEAASQAGDEIIPAKALDRVYSELMNLTQNPGNRLTLWNLAKTEDIFVLHVPADTEMEELHELCWHSLGEDVSRHITVVVIAERLSKARVALRLKGMSGHLQNCTAVYIVDDAADLGVSTLQESADDVVTFYQAFGRIGRDSRLLHFEGILGGGFVKNRIDIALAGPGSDLNLDGIYFGDNDQHIDLRTVQHHQAENAESRTYYKGAVRDEAKTVFQGLIEVNYEARGTDAFLTNKNMVLTEGASADSIPSLNIKTNDVKCSHGSTTGKIDEEQIYYLQCRGFTRAEAEEMLVLGYFEDLLSNLPEKMQHDVRQQIHSRLKGRG